MDADAVVLTEILSVEEFNASMSTGGLEAIEGGGTLMTLGPKDFGPTSEIVTHRVIKSWKGPHREGERITTVTPIDCCVCGMSVRRFQREPFAGNMDRLIARRWLIYAHGRQPYAMSVCSRTRPADSPQAIEGAARFDGVVFDPPASPQDQQ